MSDLRAVVTGASAGIGQAFARRLAARGEPLVLVARRAERLADLAAELGGESRAVSIPLDLSRPGAMVELKAELDRRGIGTRLLVNNAGVGHTGRFVEEPVERIAEMVAINVSALTLGTRTFLPEMVARGEGSIINVVSTSAFQPVPYLAVYAATKAYALSLTEAVADEIRGSGVILQALCPGLTATEFQQTAGTDRVAFNRTGALTPDEVARVSLEALAQGRLRVVVGWSNRLTILAQRFVPAAVVRRVGATLFRPPG